MTTNPQLSTHFSSAQNSFSLFFFSCPIFPPFILFLPAPSSTSIALLSSCPWVIHINSLASSLPILVLTFPCLFSTYHLSYLFSVTFLPFSPPLTTDNPPCDFHFCDSVPVLIVCFAFVLIFCLRLLIVVSLLSFYCS